MLQYDCQHKQRLLRKAINTNLIGENAMKKRIAVLLSIIMIFIFGFTVSAAEEDVTQDKTLIKHQYSGSKANFNIEISQKLPSKKLFRSNDSNASASYDTTQWGIKESIIIPDKINNQNIIIKFVENDNKIEIEEDGSLRMFNANRNMIGAASNFNVKDANGNTVNVSANLYHNNAIYYNIDDQNAEYPLSGEISLYGVDDFSQWFSGGSWIIRNGNELSLSLTHTGWAYAGCPTGLISWSWNTVVNRFSSSSNWKNAQGMADQYQCHVNFAANKNPWNLEPWRPDVGILATMAAECNP